MQIDIQRISKFFLLRKQRYRASESQMMSFTDNHSRDILFVMSQGVTMSHDAIELQQRTYC